MFGIFKAAKDFPDFTKIREETSCNMQSFDFWEAAMHGPDGAPGDA